MNACRVYAYLREGRICSKDESGVWAVSVLPQEFREIVGRALDVYRGQRIAGQFERAELARFAAHLRECLKVSLNP